MLTPNATFIAAIAESELKIAEIYDVVLANGTTVRLTTHSKDIVWNAGSDTYTSFPITRGTIQVGLEMEASDVEISVGNISGSLFDELQNNTLNLAQITIKRIEWDSSYAADLEIIKFVGIADVSFNRRDLTLTCKSFWDSLNIQVPRDIYQTSCNKRLFDGGCGLTRGDFDYAGIVTTGDDISFSDSTRGTVYKGAFDAVVDTLAIGETITGGTNGYTAQIVQVTYVTAATGFIWYVELSNSANFENDEVLSSAGDSVTLNGVPAEDISFYALGEVEVTSGNNNGERRQILKAAGNLITLQWPFPNSMTAADTYNIYPGCDKLGVTCRDKFDIPENFRGFIYGPGIDEVIF